MKKEYIASRSSGTCFVTVHQEGIAVPRMLPMRLDVANHSPSGFEWGYGGSGPAQLALALLCDHLNNDALARSLYQKFKFEIVSCLPKEGWRLTSQAIDVWVRNKTDVG